MKAKAADHLGQFLSMGIGLITGISITASIQQGSLRTLLQRKLTGTHDQKVSTFTLSLFPSSWLGQCRKTDIQADH